MSVNKILQFTWDVDEYTQSIEEGMTYREIIEELVGEYEGKLTFKSMETHYYYERNNGYDDED